MTEITDLVERLGRLEERVKRIEEINDLSPAFPPPPRKGVSISEFVRATSPKSDVEKTLVIAYFLEHFESVNPFNAHDLEAGFVRAKEAKPSNINETVNKNIHKGYIMELSAKKNGTKAWALTNSGDSHVVELKRVTTGQP